MTNFPLRRRSFSPGDAEALAAFCAANDSPFDASLVRRLVCDLTSAREGVFVLGDALGLAVVATVVDRALNAAGAATLELLGARSPLSGEALVEHIVDPALSFASSGSSRALHVPLYSRLVDCDSALTAMAARRFVRIYDLVSMRRPPTGLLAPASLPPGWHWEEMEDRQVARVHAALREIFADAAGVSLGPLDEFRQAAVTAARQWRLLFDGDRLAGLVRVGDREPTVGRVEILGRLPEYRGRGLGPLLLGEALRLLTGAEGREVLLDVEVQNAGAVDLYRRFGFEVVSRTPVLGIRIGPGP